ncbi:hypothetical protein IW261DRAFT_1675949 [Armillaria novae-zelandiae]|uniref:Uncharacterized protein n=1 Tax=Armillaria novae-zelandiae TaxID=153914 RepID=A0AA39UEM3_9AGAR|nr:hypothetical protein IW261DRAFT_1675949 [Armillaria novae-zelandiae]
MRTCHNPIFLLRRLFEKSHLRYRLVYNINELHQDHRLKDCLFLSSSSAMDSESDSDSTSTHSASSSTSGLSTEDEVMVTEDVKEVFYKEFKKRPNVHDLMYWKQHQNNMVCKNCLLHGQDCTPKENSAVCISCEEQRVGCSRVEQERRTRVRRLLKLSYPELDFLVAWDKKRRVTKGSLSRRPPITPSPRKKKFQDSPALSPEIQARTARVHRREPEQDQNASSSASRNPISTPIQEYDPVDQATATNFQELWNQYMNDDQTEHPQTPSGGGSAVFGPVTPEHTDIQLDLVMTDYDVLGISTEHVNTLVDEGEASTTEVQDEGATRNVAMPAENQAALTKLELLLHRKEVENIAARVKSGNITQLELVKALEALSKGLFD